MKRYVLDSFSILAYAQSEKGADEVSRILNQSLDNHAELYMSVINWGEVYYIILRESGKELAEQFIGIIDRYPITIVDADKELTLLAAGFKAFNKMSYADAFAAALSKIKKAILVTGDKEFKSVGNEIKIQWI
jgi:predicted nucleic acid-binding protein